MSTYGVLTGGAGRWGSAIGFSCIIRSTSSTARSSCGSWPAITDRGSFSTSMSGSTPMFSTTQLPSAALVPNCGTLTEPPSMSGPWLVMPMTPPHERLPISGPSPASRKR